MPVSERKLAFAFVPEPRKNTPTVNLIHRWICRSGHWKRLLREEIVPWVLEDIDLGQNVLEVGPGPGLTTDLLRQEHSSITAIEIDDKLAAALDRRLNGSNVKVVHGDATAMPFADGSFSGAVAFTVLHHVPSALLQDRLLRQVCRVLKPGGVFAGVDSLPRPFLYLAHIGDTFVPIDPGTFGSRLEAAGLTDVKIERRDKRFRFRARRP